MVYGAEVVLPTGLDYGAPRVRAYDEAKAKEDRQNTLDQLNEARDMALLRSTKYQQTLRRYHSKNARGRAFQVSDLVLRRVQATKDMHKLSPPWEGPFTITKVICPGAYLFKNHKGRTSTNTWNIKQLRQFYP